MAMTSTSMCTKLKYVLYSLIILVVLRVRADEDKLSSQYRTHNNRHLLNKPMNKKKHSGPPQLPHSFNPMICQDQQIHHHDITNSIVDNDAWLSDSEISTFTGVSPLAMEFVQVKHLLLGFGSSIMSRTNIKSKIESIRNIDMRDPIDITMLDDRENIPLAMDKAHIVGPTVEIGVRKGDFAYYLVGNKDLSMYHAIDPWSEQPKEIYNDPANKDKNTQMGLCRDAILNIRDGLKTRNAPFPSYYIWRNFSDSVASQFQDESLALVYIDGNHGYEAALLDMELYWPKVSQGGILAGHDAESFGVPQAIETFLKSRPELHLRYTQKAPKSEISGNSPVIYDELLKKYIPAPFKTIKEGVRHCCPTFYIQKDVQSTNWKSKSHVD